MGKALETVSERLICVVGPTASGKTSFAVELAKKINGEIISADSMQIYKKMNIGTAKPEADEMQGIKHYMIDEISPFDNFSVNDFVIRAKEYVSEIHKKGKIPIVAGGTGLFISSLVDNVSFSETKTDFKLREKLQNDAQENGNEYVHKILEKIDPESAARIHPNNLKRVIRAIEIYETSGMTMSEHIAKSKLVPSPYELYMIGLITKREILYDRINKRVDKMLSAGLIDEVSSLIHEGLDLSYNSMQGIGYKETYAYIAGDITLNELADTIKQETRRYAKRQITWFKRDKRIKWADISAYNTNEKLLEFFFNEYKI